MDKIQSDVHWYLIEVDDTLIEAGIEYLLNFFHEKSLQVTSIPNGIKVQNDYRLVIHYVQTSIFDINKTQWLFFDGILGNALLDVFSKQQVNQLLQNLSFSHIPKLFTIIYKNMKWGDDDPLNDFYVKRYNQHMQRDQKGMRGLGANCIKCVERLVGRT